MDKKFIIRLKTSAINTTFLLLGVVFVSIAACIWSKVISFDKTLIKIGDSVSIGLTTELHSNVFGLMVAVLYLVSCVYSIGYNKEYKTTAKWRFHCLYFNSSLIAFLMSMSVNLFTLFIFYETLTLVTYSLVCFTKTKKSIIAAKTYLLTLMIPSMLLLLPVIMIIYLQVGSVNFSQGGILHNSGFSNAEIEILFLMTIFGLAKTAIIPLHKWLPTAMIASIPVSGLLHAVAVVKSGVFALFLMIYYIFGSQFLQDSIEVFFGLNWFTWLCIAGVLYSSLTSLSCEKIKARLAYSTISYLSLIMLIMSFFNDKLMNIVIQYIVCHGFIKILLFYSTGLIQHVTQKDSVLDISGTAKFSRFSFIAFFIGILFIIGAHGSGMYHVKHIFTGTLLINKQYLVLSIVLIGSLCSVVSLGKIVYYGFFRAVQDSCIVKHKLDFRMKAGVFALIVMNLLMYLYYSSIFS